MRKGASYLLGCLIILLLGSSMGFGADSGSGPVRHTKDQTILSSPGEKVAVWGEKFSVPRNQVLLEIFTATW